MAEQEQEEIAEEEEESEEEEEEEITVVPKLNTKKYNPAYHQKDFVEKLGSYYVDTQSYAETARLLNSDFGTTISPDQVKVIYIKKMAYKITHDKSAGEFFEDSFKRMKARWEDAWWMIGDLVKQYKILRKRIGEETDTNKATLMMKLAPTIIQITEAIRKQLEFIQKQQEQIKVSQETLIFSPTQINQQITPILKNLIEEGKIAILQDIPEWKISKKKKEKK